MPVTKVGSVRHITKDPSDRFRYMKTKSLAEHQMLLPLGAFVYTAIFTLWEYVNGGVVTHHLLADEDMPGVSNWWGLVIIPLLAWITVAAIRYRRRGSAASLQDLRKKDKIVLKRFLAALIFGMGASLLWKFKLDDVLQYYILIPVVIAFFRPVHLPEFLLGFTLGMLYSFGGVLPVIVGLVLMILCFVIRKLTQWIGSAVVSK